MSGRPRSRITRSGLRVPRFDQALPAGLGVEHPEALRTESGPQEAPHLRVVLDADDCRPGFAHDPAAPALRSSSGSMAGGTSSSGSVKVNSAPPPARFSAPDRAAVGGDDRAADRQPEADAALRPLAIGSGPVELLEEAIGFAPAECRARGQRRSPRACRRHSRAWRRCRRACPRACTSRRSRADSPAPARSARHRDARAADRAAGPR